MAKLGGMGISKPTIQQITGPNTRPSVGSIAAKKRGRGPRKVAVTVPLPRAKGLTLKKGFGGLRSF